ncbi:hypothetical protein DFQ30_008346 [Apophysomyces sp. BC1015]|nr:hypothetical protein DFQ30_008346 [Apophysomyces sp. BC1015]
MSCTQKRCSIYDSLPTLESWYCDNNTQQPDCAIKKKKRCPSANRNVSFSPKPPSIHYLNQEEYEDEEELKEFEKALMESNSVKAFFRHCAKKLTRRRASSGSRSVAPMY